LLPLDQVFIIDAFIEFCYTYLSFYTILILLECENLSLRKINSLPLMLFLLLVGTIFSSCNDQNPPPMTKSINLKTHIATPTPTLTSIPHSHLPAAHLGDSLAVFEHVYGKHNDSFVDSYMWVKKQNDPYFEISTDSPTRNAYEITQHYYVLGTPLGQGDVPLNVAQAACEKYKPQDSKLISIKKQGVGAPGIQYIYMSKTLASSLNPDDFKNDNAESVPLESVK
jgi:hypothetical protein